MNFQIASRSVSNKRENEDRIVVLPFDDLVVFGVFDGVGGRAGGAQAAELGVQTVKRHASPMRDARKAHTWAQLLGFVDEALEADADAGETTGVLVAAGEGWVSGASVGDSEAWLIHRSKVEVLTRNGKPYLGYGGALAHPFEAKWNGVLLLASDGLTKYAALETIAQIVGAGDDLETAVDALIEATRYPSGDLPDDVSVILCRNETPASSTKARRWWKR